MTATATTITTSATFFTSTSPPSSIDDWTPTPRTPHTHHKKRAIPRLAKPITPSISPPVTSNADPNSISSFLIKLIKRNRVMYSRVCRIPRLHRDDSRMYLPALEGDDLDEDAEVVEAVEAPAWDAIPSNHLELEHLDSLVPTDVNWHQVALMSGALMRGEVQWGEVDKRLRRWCAGLIVENEERRAEKCRVSWAEEVAQKCSSNPPKPPAPSTLIPPSSVHWSCPSLSLTFSPPASLESVTPTRIFKFSPNQTFSMSPSPSLAPSIISLLAAGPALTHCTALDIELTARRSGLRGGDLSDSYSGTLRFTPPNGEPISRSVVVKLIVPTAFAHPQAAPPGSEPYFSTAGKAELYARAEADFYGDNLAPLVGSSVPVYYGLWECETELEMAWGDEARDGWKVMALVTEECGETLEANGSELSCLSALELLQILIHFIHLQNRFISLGSLTPSHIRAGPDGTGRVVNFSRALHHTFALGMELNRRCEDLGVEVREAKVVVERVNEVWRGMRTFLDEGGW
ncbi:hypothetical protein IAT38_004203 [Cryptococcus sp. DSM 104549]